ncbi:succinate dehydrogenase [ubiquinone] cytochrome b small subunit, mitochondrial [Orussus abietinus]|uniref:succinate dehydrogenase [ubiquinone] cytochrome b small subunit, mitochondrial n=1 Tax=Orussus abietinus TaxID=222816 RepID=UPI000625CD4A|nr:succinate dehydrogenase [ubiquinone] cytochrome b small subunit, mitochondrial [Orussus abietinus]
MASSQIMRSLRFLPAKLTNSNGLFATNSFVPFQFTKSLSTFSNIKPVHKVLLNKPALCISSIQTPVIPNVNGSQLRMATTGGDHVRLWQIERLLSTALIPILPACVILQNPVVDGLTAILIVMHSYWGLEAVVIDYARPIVVGPIVPKIAHILLNLLSAATLAGLFVLIYNGPGIGKTIKNVWTIGKED